MPPRKNGCYDRPPLGGHPLPVQDGWIPQPLGTAATALGQSTRIPVIVEVPFVMEVDCQYSRTTTDDPGCDGCKRKWPGP